MVSQGLGPRASRWRGGGGIIWFFSPALHLHSGWCGLNVMRLTSSLPSHPVEELTARQTRQDVGCRMRSKLFNYLSRCEHLARLWVDVLAAGGAGVPPARNIFRNQIKGGPQEALFIVSQGLGFRTPRWRAGGGTIWIFSSLLNFGSLAGVGSMCRRSELLSRVIQLKS